MKIEQCVQKLLGGSSLKRVKYFIIKWCIKQ